MKSQAQVLSAWFLRKVDHVCPPPLVRTPRMYFWMVRLLTLMPSLSSSPRIRSAPQSRPRRAMSRMSSTVSAGSGEPLRGRDLERQKRPESGSVPAKDGVRLHDRDGATPGRQERGTDDQLQPVDWAQRGSLDVPPEDVELVAKHGVLDHQLVPGTTRVSRDPRALASGAAKLEFRTRGGSQRAGPSPSFEKSRAT